MDLYSQYYLGLLVIGKDDPLALARLNEVIKISPDFKAARIARGDLLLRLGRFDDAYKDYSEVFNTDGKDYLICQKIANLFYQRNQNEKALEWAELAGKLHPADYNLLILRGKILYRQKNFEKALSDFTEASQMNPTMQEAYFHIGLCYESMENYEKAGDYYRYSLLEKKDKTIMVESIKKLQKDIFLPDSHRTIPVKALKFYQNAARGNTFELKALTNNSKAAARQEKIAKYLKMAEEVKNRKSKLICSNIKISTTKITFDSAIVLVTGKLEFTGSNGEKLRFEEFREKLNFKKVGNKWCITGIEPDNEWF
jgi:tetratricopeptide (TPR) repeat protein